MTATDLEKCKKYLRATLLASKGGILANKVYEMYQEQVGSGIPYRQFNYPSLETFLQSMPDVCRITCKGVNKDIYVEGVANSQTKHIEKLVRGQKGPAGGKKGGGPTRSSAKGFIDCRKYYPGIVNGHGNVQTLRNNSSLNSSGTKTSQGFLGSSGGRNSWKKSPPSSPPKTVKSSRPSLLFGLPSRSSNSIQQQPIKSSMAAKSSISQNVNNFSPPTSVSSSPSYPTTNEPIKVWSARVKKILEGRQHGLYRSQIEKCYEKQWLEKLPSSWKNTMLVDGIIRQESGSNIFGNSLVFLVPPTEPNTNGSVSSIPCGTYPTDIEWHLTVTNIVSTSNLWVIFGDAQKNLDNIQPLMGSRHGHGTAFGGGSMPPGNYFSASLDTGEFVRVKVTKVDRINYKCQCFLIDYGREMSLDWQQLVALDKDFLSLPSMAMKVIIDCIEDSKDQRLLDCVRSKLLGNTYVGVEVKKDVSNVPKVMLLHGDKVISDDLAKQLRKLQQDVKSTLKVTINNNYCNGVKGYSKSQVLATPPIPNAGDFYDLKISHIVSAKEIYVQSYTSLPRYRELSQNMAEYYNSEGYFKTLDKFVSGLLVAVRHCGEWRRAELISEVNNLPGVDEDESNFLVNILDCGEHVIAKIDDIRELPFKFGQLPMQVVRMELTGIESCGEAGLVWLKHLCLGKDFVGFVDSKNGNVISVTLYDTTVKDLDIVINDEMIQSGLFNI